MMRLTREGEKEYPVYNLIWDHQGNISCPDSRVQLPIPLVGYFHEQTLVL